VITIRKKTKRRSVLTQLKFNIDKKKKSNEIKPELNLEKQKGIQSLSNIEDIKDYYEYADMCLSMIPKLTAPNESQLEEIKKQLNFPEEFKYQKVAIFDLDETLIHVDYINIYSCDKIVTIMHPKEGPTKIGVNIRPKIIESLKKIKENYVIIVFTASHSLYADPIIDLIDPNKSLISHRLYRSSCMKVKSDTNDDIYVKDLRIFKGFNLENLLIIDNSILSFAFHLDNGIPILPFKDNKNDNEFPILVNYLNYLATVDDVRVENRKYLKLDYFLKKKKLNSNSSNSSSYYSEEIYTSNSDSNSRLNNQSNNNNIICLENSILSSNSNINNNDLSKISEKSDAYKIKRIFEENMNKFHTVFKRK